jgi:peptidoglycan/LPS O-acetylase OafA/YrhL
LPATQETLPPADLKALTSLRFFAAFMIFMFHLQNYDATPWLQAIGGSMRHGVSFFFVLSGFILTHVYSSREKLDPRMFFLSRFARLYPTVLA